MTINAPRTGELYIVCQFNSIYPNGRMSKAYSSHKEANDLIRVQKETLCSDSNWKILHIKESEWLDYTPTPKKETSVEELYQEEENDPYWNR